MMNEMPANLMWHLGDPRLTQPTGSGPVYEEDNREAEVREALAVLRREREKGTLDQPNNPAVWEDEQ